MQKQIMPKTLILLLFSIQLGFSQKPNVLVLLADDLGYGDLSGFGSATIQTPYLDKLANQGVRLTSFYSGSAVCTPSRACFLTGQYPRRFGIGEHFKDQGEHLPLSSITLAEILLEAGYFTAHIGKWHLGGLRLKDLNNKLVPGPLEHGFLHAVTNVEGAPIRSEHIKNRTLYREGYKTVIKNGKRVRLSPKHLTTLEVDEALEAVRIAQKKQQPFFVNLWFDAPHTPYEPAPEPHLSKYKEQGAEGDQLLFRSMVSHLDAEIGRLLDSLQTMGALDNTIVLFSSDNGPAYQGSPGPFKGGKTDLHEGGIRVPFIAYWKEHIENKGTVHSPMHMVDILPTIASLTNTRLPIATDGKNKSNLLVQNGAYQQENYFWQMNVYSHFQNQGPKPQPYATAIYKEGPWKLLADDNGPTELFYLPNDPREIYNLKEKEGERVNIMYEKLLEFLQEPMDTSGYQTFENEN